MRYLFAALILSATIAACGNPPEGSYGTGKVPSHTLTASYGTGVAR